MIKQFRHLLSSQGLLVLILIGFVPVSFGEISHVSAGNNYTCVIDDGAVACGGENTVGQLDVPLLSGARALSAGVRDFRCGLKLLGTAIRWFIGHSKTGKPREGLGWQSPCLRLGR
jgi:hypothetical protein